MCPTRPLAIRDRLAAFVLAAALAAPALAAMPQPPAVGAKDRQAILDDVVAALNETYVFPETAKKMEEHVRRQLAGGAYDRLTTLDAFTQQLTEDLRSVSKDLHLGVQWDPEEPAPAAGPALTPEQRQERFLAAVKRDNYCFRKVERMAGNVGYLRLDCFAPAELGGATAVAAMGFLAGSDALIFDLRQNGGGNPSMIQLLTSYLLKEEPTHLNSFYVRKGDRTDQFWTQAWVPGTRLPDVPVFVLTSSRTFSGAEEFSYNLKNLKRGTIVGETTGGGAHPTDQHQVAGYPVVVSLPFGRAVNPISGTNWEGTGVAPDVAVPATEALEVAHARALAAIAEKTTDPQRKAEVEFARAMVEDRRAAVTLSESELDAYAGSYGPRTVTREGGVLWYQRAGGPKTRLQPVGQDRFLLADVDFFRIRFERDAAGKVVRLVGIYADGREEPNPRDGG